MTKFLDDYVVNRFLDAQTNGVPVSKYLEMNVIEFLGTSTAHVLEENDISVTKFLETALANFLLDDSVVAKFLQENDITVTKFMDSDPLYNDISVTKFMDSWADENDISITKFMDSQFQNFVQ